MKREDDIGRYRQQMARRRVLSAQAYESKYAATTRDDEFKPIRLILVHDKPLEWNLGKKFSPRYNGLYIIVSCQRVLSHRRTRRHRLEAPHSCLFPSPTSHRQPIAKNSSFKPQLSSSDNGEVSGGALTGDSQH